MAEGYTQMSVTIMFAIRHGIKFPKTRFFVSVCSMLRCRQVASQLICGRASLRTLDAGFSPLKTGFDPGPMHVVRGSTGWFWDRSVLERVHFVLRPVSIIPPVLHTALRLNTTLTRRTSGRSMGISSKA